MTDNNRRSIGRPRSDEQSQPTHRIILQAAMDLFLTYGYQEVSVDDVAKKCNFTKATIYYYYKSKGELFTETIVQMMFQIRRHIQSILQEDIPLRTRLQKILEEHLKATNDIDLDGFMRETKNALSQDQIKTMQAAEEDIYKVIEKTFEDALTAGEISHINPSFAALMYISLVKAGNYRDTDNQAIFTSAEEAAEQITHFFWNGLFSN
ncbi:TetR/AcrR family transcriptional regulator [Tuberibacillus sp. Marseille-P3662]|uniref:TetR/AcrR family transcriptional regulator n=1 Tax=Tuberibacillus sp. Marseille-P3662 TaxID=1965358 RepID=UPI0020CAF556|nr:TetR/AcrR family transcriptional regulator [Tuberibacillus sp. Marseille-P3662]